ncbi:MAG: YtxH domain-containing protein [Paludibacteraceae bacterium]|nr:YtxH domain-containing protein [Paludibacteraceae bacterium]
MENLENSILDELRQQNELLKQKLEDQVIVSRLKLEKVREHNLTNILNDDKFLFALGIFAIIFPPLQFYFVLNTSIYFAIATALFMAYSFFRLIRRHRWMKTLRNMDTDLLSYVDKLKLAMRKEYTMRAPEIILLTLWLIWLGIEIYMQTSDQPIEYIIGLSVGCLVGGLIGAAFGLLYLKKTRRRLQAIIDQVEEYRSLANE